MRQKIALSIFGLAIAASLAPLHTASAVCGPDLSAVGGPSCPNLCPGIVVATVNDVVGSPFIACAA